MALVSGSPSMSPSNSGIKAQRNGQTLIKVVMPLHTPLAMKKLGKNKYKEHSSGKPYIHKYIQYWF